MSRPIDLDMLAYDIADILDRNDYGLDVDSDDVRAALPYFLALLGGVVTARAATGPPDLTPDPSGDL